MHLNNTTPIRSISTPHGTVTQGFWNAGGTLTSRDGYTTYEISAFQHWYSYSKRPKWFGQNEGDRYLKKSRRWLSRHCDGNQERFIPRYGAWNGVTMRLGSRDDSTQAAQIIQHVMGYIRPWHGVSELREKRKNVDGPRLQRHCVCCGMTRAEIERKRSRRSFELAWPSGFRRGMDAWDARQKARQEITCRCA